MKEEKLLTFDDVIERYKFKVHGLRWLIRTRQIPIVKIGKKRIYFDPEQLEDWKKKQSLPARKS